MQKNNFCSIKVKKVTTTPQAFKFFCASSGCSGKSSATFLGRAGTDGAAAASIVSVLAALTTGRDLIRKESRNENIINN